MSLEKIIGWACVVVLTFTASGQLPQLQYWIWRAQAQVVEASRTSHWGSPRFFPREHLN